MNGNEVFRAILAEEGLTQEQAAKVMGLKGQGNIARLLNYGISFDKLYDLGKPLGYRLVMEKVMPNGKVRERYELEK